MERKHKILVCLWKQENVRSLNLRDDIHLVTENLKSKEKRNKLYSKFFVQLYYKLLQKL